jgi:hypothetical protein
LAISQESESQSKWSKMNGKEQNYLGYFFIGLIIALLSIALLILIVKNCRLLSENKFLNENLDRLCKDNVYEKVD